MSAYHNIPKELQAIPQWVCWRLEKRDGAKPTKVPFAPRPGGKKAKVAGDGAAATWGTFADACAAPFTCLEPCDADAPVDQTGFTGIGFVFTRDDPYAFIDLDDTHGDQEAYQRQLLIFSKFQSYSELSPSGNGLHIIVKGALPHGRRRADVEIYSSERYATFTGNVQFHAPIEERQELLDTLFGEMGGPPTEYAVAHDSPQVETDDNIVSMATGAVNGEKFYRLWTGDWESMYSSQSEADFALVDILAFYTQNVAQIARLFRTSALGQRDKAQRDDYVGYMVNKSFDRQLPKVDIDGLRIAFEQRRSALAGEPGGTPTSAHDEPQPHLDRAPPEGAGIAAPLTVASGGVAVNPFPRGLVGQVAQFLFDAAPRQVPDIALAGAIGLMAGITGRAYNVSGTGLNQYILLLAATGSGKELIATGTGKIMGEVIRQAPVANDFKGPGELVSSAGLIRWLATKPSAYSILGEFGIKLKEMASPTANPHLASLERIMLQLYSKSGHGSTLDPSAYSDSTKNTAAIVAPSFTMLGESVPERFYEMLDDTMIASGLMPRFMVFEYRGPRLYLNEGTENVRPSIDLVQRMADLCGTALTLAHNQNVCNVQLDRDATARFREFERWTTDQINEAKSETLKQLWNRAHIKALKLAAVIAVGINPHAPTITVYECEYATDLIVAQTRRLIVKFETGQVGHANNAEGKQLAAVVRCISEYLNHSHDKVAKTQPREDMHQRGVIPESYVSRRLISQACFRNDRIGSTGAIKRALKMLCEADELRELPKAQMQATFGCGPRAYVVANASRFILKADDED